MALVRRHIFIDGDIVRANHLEEEYDQLYSFLTGILSGKLTIENSLAFPALMVSNLSRDTNTPVISFKKANVEKFKFKSFGDVESLVEDVAPFIITSTTKVVSLNAEFLDGLSITSFLTTGKKIDQYIPFYFDGIPVVGDKLTWIAPAGTTMLINQFFASSAKRVTYPDSEAEIDLVFAKNGVIQLSLVLIQPLFSYLNATPISFSIAENDLLTVEVTAISGDIPPRNIACKMRFRQDLVTG